jgi:hypothetical protein
MERPHAAPAGSNQWRGSLVRVRKGTTQGNTESRVGRPAVWSAVSALLLMVQVPNSEPVDRFLPRTGVGDLPHRRWLHLGSCRPSMTRRSGLARSAATSAYGAKRTCSMRRRMSASGGKADAGQQPLPNLVHALEHPAARKLGCGRCGFRRY